MTPHPGPGLTVSGEAEGGEGRDGKMSEEGREGKVSNERKEGNVSGEGKERKRG